MTIIRSEGGAGGIGGTVTRSADVLTSVGNILAFPFTNDTLDASGNHVIDSGTPNIVTTGTYTYGEGMLECTAVNFQAPRIIAASQAHQIPHTSPVTFGFFMMGTVYHGTLQLMVSGGGGNDGNYGIQRQGSAGWRFQGIGVTTMGDHRDITPTGRWYHICLAIDSTSRGTGGNAAEFYINGHPVWSGNVGAAQVVSTDHDFSFLCDADEQATDITGRFSHAFVTDTVPDRATIRALSDEAFGHASPLWAAAVP